MSEKIFRFSPDPNQLYITAVPFLMEGGSRSSRTRNGMRWTLRGTLTNVQQADGEVVWS
jgi:hypothetical protein